MKILLNLHRIQARTWQMNDSSLQYFKKELETIINNYLVANKGDSKILYDKIYHFQILYYIWTPIFEAFANFTAHVDTFPKEACFVDLTKEQQELLIKLADAVLLFWNFCIPSLVTYYKALLNNNIVLEHSVTHNLVNPWFYLFLFFIPLNSFYDLPKTDNLKSSEYYANEIFNLVTKNEFHFKLMAECLVSEQFGLVYDKTKDYREQLRILFIKYWSRLKPEILLFILLSTKDYALITINEKVLESIHDKFDFSVLLPNFKFIYAKK